MKRQSCRFGAAFCGLGASGRSVRRFTSFREAVSSRIEQAKSNGRVEKGNSQYTPVSDRGPLIPFLFGLGLFYGGAGLNYLYWGWLE